MNIPIVYQDEWLEILNKPSGLLTVPTPKNETRTLTSILNDDLIDRRISYRLHPCHRLDRDTSGLIIYAKGKSTQEKMMQLFKFRKIKKRYTAFVNGKVSHNQGQINQAIQGESALTQYKVLERRQGFTIVELEPFTGRTNQLRIHLKGLGHPILGEEKYAFRRDFKIRAKRLCLHAGYLNFLHPITNEKVEILCDLPQELQDFLKLHK